MATYRTADAVCEYEIDKVKGSRFIAKLWPVRDAHEAQEMLAARRAEHRDATHHCWAYRLGLDPESRRFSDDGEPAGTAGRPILQEIDARRLTNVLLVVTRYYGGTKLGTGGLLRAYSESASALLDRVEIREVMITRRLICRFDYDLTGAVMATLAAFRVQPAAASYDELTTLDLDVPEEQEEELRRQLRDATTGRILFPAQEPPK